MRHELRDLVLQYWSELPEVDAEGYGYMDHVSAVLAMKPTPRERKELASLLLEVEGDDVVGTLTGVMEEQPDPLYRDVLIQALDSPDRRKTSWSMRALLRGGYEGALEILFSRADVQTAMRDEFPWELWDLAKDLPEPMQRRYLALFCERFKDDPPLHMATRRWLGTLAEIPLTNEETVATLCRTWQRLGPRDMHDRYLVLQSMAASPVPAYEPALKQAARSRVPDLKLTAREGLTRLQQPRMDGIGTSNE